MAGVARAHGQLVRVGPRRAEVMERNRTLSADVQAKLVAWCLAWISLRPSLNLRYG